MVRSRSLAHALAAGLVVACSLLSVPASADEACRMQSGTAKLDRLPAHFRQLVSQGRAVRIVAIGSSSTWGSGATTRDASYPSRLEAELKARVPGLAVTVLNKGVGGEEAAQMVARFQTDVLDEKPDLVLWQVGSNSLLRDHPTPEALIRQGLSMLKARDTEVVVMNPQFAPKIVVKPDADRAVALIDATAHAEGIGVFNRFGLMRYWYESEKLPFDQFITPDGVHMNDWGYACVAKVLADALLEGVKLPVIAKSGATASLKP